MEATGRNDGIPSDRYMKGNKLAWCAGFQMYCNDHSDDPKIAESVREFWRYTNVQEFEERFKERGLWFGWSIRPQRNDLVFFANRGRSDLGRGRHIGIIERVDGAFIYTIEGNLSNKVTRDRHKITNNRITGYGRLCEL